jgi:predicted dehydrogenase
MMNEMDLLFTDDQLKLEGNHKLWISDKVRESLERVELGGEPSVFQAQWNDMLDAIERGCEPGISGAYGQSVAEVVAAIYRSHESGAE